MAWRQQARDVASTHGAGCAASVRRIQLELKDIHQSPSRHWTASPLADDLFEWMFAVRGPPGTDFEGGIYTGRLVLPVNYPLAPPSLELLTPNGRWEVGKKICLSNTNYHPEAWQPAWGIRTMIEALRSHFPVPGEGAVGSIDYPSHLRQKLARESLDFAGGPDGRRNRLLLPELSAEEMREDLPEDVPDGSPPPPQAAPTGSADAPPHGGETSNPQADGDEILSFLREEGHRRRLAALAVEQSGAVAPQLSPLQPPPALEEASSASAAPPHAVPEDVESRSAPAMESCSAPAQPRRRRRSRGEAGARQGLQGSLLVRFLRPPASWKGWCQWGTDFFIGILLVSLVTCFLSLLVDPPQLLSPPP